ncbi:MAG: ATP-dependent RecD-like DNA helicase [Bacilli bacterium]|nr:ATP-dependent RecD-like DNA helicase [Bacilli bacterium]
MGYIKGTFKKIIFEGNNNYVVGLFRIKETDIEDLYEFVTRTITITGYFHELTVDEKYIMNGEVSINKRFGMQFNVESYDRLVPEGKDAIVEFLSSGLFKGIGEKTAEDIVNVLGDDTLKLIEDNYTNLLIVPSINEKKAKSIYETLIKYNESYNIIVYLNSVGFNTKDSMLIYNTYKDNSINVVKNNVYSLIDDIEEITYQKIEKIRKNLGIEDNDKYRIIYSIIYVMKNLCFMLGDTYLSIDDIYNKLDDVLGFEFSLLDLEFYLYELQKLGKVIIYNSKYFLSEYYKAETNIADTLYYLSNQNDTKVKNINNHIEYLELMLDIKFNPEQKKAIKTSIQSNFSIITGGPGTGKTTIIKGIVELYKKINNLTYIDLCNKMALLAPTGRAAKRMGESALMPASTIHRFLKWNKETDTFMINSNNKSDVEFVIIDEVSMIDTILLDNLLKGLRKNVKIVMIGDYNQLESVGPGKVLKDLIDSDMVNVVKLNTLYRQKENSYIATLAHEIKDNNLGEAFYQKRDDFNFIESDNYNIKKVIKELCLRAKEKGFDSRDIQVLAPMYKGENGIDNFNKLLQDIFNPKIDQNEIKYMDVIYREGDKVLKLENDPDNNVFNGDIGYIIDVKNSEITIDFDSNIVKYSTKDLSSIKHGYAISIHKAQGSEFKIVFMPITMSYKAMLYKKLIYTGVTRAKYSLTLIGSKDAFLYAVENTNAYERRTDLKGKLLDCINK